jgi:hypothetical protein
MAWAGAPLPCLFKCTRSRKFWKDGLGSTSKIKLQLHIYFFPHHFFNLSVLHLFFAFLEPTPYSNRQKESINVLLSSHHWRTTISPGSCSFFIYLRPAKNWKTVQSREIFPGSRVLVIHAWGELHSAPVVVLQGFNIYWLFKCFPVDYMPQPPYRLWLPSR